MKAVIKSLVVSIAAVGGLIGSINVAQAGVTGNIGVVSNYILRGITETYNATYDNSGPESDSPALQGGLDYSHDSGFYAGYWFSTIGYSYADLDPNKTKGSKNSIEHDLYAGFTGKAGELGYTVGGTVYYYEPGWESLGYETKLGVSYGPVSLTAQTLLNDVTFGNKGDTYYLGTYTQALPKDFTFTGQLGFYTYKKNGEFIPESVAVNGKDIKCKSSAFRHLTVGVTHPLAATGATWGVQYIVGGENRYGLDQDNTLVGSLSMTF